MVNSTWPHKSMSLDSPHHTSRTRAFAHPHTHLKCYDMVPGWSPRDEKFGFEERLETTPREITSVEKIVISSRTPSSTVHLQQHVFLARCARAKKSTNAKSPHRNLSLLRRDAIGLFMRNINKCSRCTSLLGRLHLLGFVQQTTH